MSRLRRSSQTATPTGRKVEFLTLDSKLSKATEPVSPFSDRVWELRANVTSCDAWYVALAELFDCPLLTLDRKIANATGPKCPVVTPPFLDS